MNPAFGRAKSAPPNHARTGRWAAADQTGKRPISASNFQVLLISLADATERRAKMRARLESLGMTFRFVDGVDGRSEDLTRLPIYNRAKRVAAYGTDLMSGEIGCFLAHKRCYEMIVEEQMTAALILEDDVDLRPEFSAVIAEIVQSDIDFDIIRFLGQPKTVAKGMRPIFKLRCGYTVGRVKSTPGSGHAYLLSQNAARKLLEIVDRTGIYLPIDIVLARQWETGLTGYAVLSDLAMSPEDQTISFIGPERFAKRASDEAPPFVMLTKAWFNTRTAIGKRWMYWSSFWRDRSLRASHVRGKAV